MASGNLKLPQNTASLISISGGDHYFLFLVFNNNSAEKCQYFEMTWFQRLWRPAGTLLGLYVAHEGENVAYPWARIMFRRGKRGREKDNSLIITTALTELVV